MKKNILLLTILMLLGANADARMVREMTVVNWASKYKMSIKTSAGQWIEFAPKTYKNNLFIDLDAICGKQPAGDTLQYYSQFITAQCVKSPCIESGICSASDGSIQKAADLTGSQGENIYLILDAGRFFFGGIEKYIDQLAGEKLSKGFYGSITTSYRSAIKGLCVGVGSYGNDNDALQIILKGLREIK